MKHDEQDLERQCCALAREQGWAAWKNEANGNKGIPDASFLHPSGVFFMVEFKNGKISRISREQQIWAQKFARSVFFCHNLEEFLRVIKEQTDRVNNLSKNYFTPSKT